MDNVRLIRRSKTNCCDHKTQPLARDTMVVQLVGTIDKLSHRGDILVCSACVMVYVSTADLLFGLVSATGS